MITLASEGGCHWGNHLPMDTIDATSSQVGAESVLIVADPGDPEATVCRENLQETIVSIAPNVNFYEDRRLTETLDAGAAAAAALSLEVCIFI